MAMWLETRGLLRSSGTTSIEPASPSASRQRANSPDHDSNSYKPVGVPSQRCNSSCQAGGSVVLWSMRNWAAAGRLCPAG